MADTDLPLPPDPAPGKSPEEKPQVRPLSPNKQAIEDFSWDLPFFRTVWNFFVREGEAVKNGWVAVAVIVGIAIYLTYSCESDNAKDKISELKGQLTSAKQDRDKYEIMLSPFQAMALEKYTNAPLDQRLDLLTRSMTSFTNAIYDIESERPALILRINEVFQTNIDSTPGAQIVFSPFAIKRGGDVLVSVVNFSKIAATHITVSVMIPVDPTNIKTVGWGQQPPDEHGWNQWQTTAETPTAQNAAFVANPLTISANLQAQPIEMIFRIWADGSKVSEYATKFYFQ